jgi:SAM-dependent methyltransferase
MMPPIVYAEPKRVTDLSECHFYHSMDLPGYGAVDGEWDLRGRESDYLGAVEFSGKRVLEIGAASGHLTFWMERAGADVLAYDLSPRDSIDVVPYARTDVSALDARLAEHIARLNNGFWLAHSVHGSRARLVYGTVYAIPPQLGTFDIGVVGSVLLHLRDPFLALQNVTRHVRETIVVADINPPLLHRLPGAGHVFGRFLYFRPRAVTCSPPVTWWRLAPGAVREMIAVLGFEQSEVRFHRQLFRGRSRRLFTVIGRRTHGAAIESG